MLKSMTTHQTIVAGEHRITSIFWLKVSKHFKAVKDQALNIEKVAGFAVGFSLGDTAIYVQFQPKVRVSASFVHKY
jgi:phosphatidylserine decarboxylase